MRGWREIWPFATAIGFWYAGLSLAAILGRQPQVLASLAAWACVYVGALFFALSDRRTRDRAGVSERKGA